MESLCKGCTESVIVSNELIDEMLENAARSGIKLVSDEEYDERLRNCASCPSLKYGTTCMHSGSLVAYRAKLATATCPHPAASNW